jgi:hypothetical protein
MEQSFGKFRSIENAVYEGLTRWSEPVFVLRKGLTGWSETVFVLHKGFEVAKKGREVECGAFGEAEWAEIVGISNSVLHLPRIYTQEV